MMTPEKDYAQSVDSNSTADFVKDYKVRTEAAVKELLKEAWGEVDEHEAPENFGELLESEISSQRPCTAYRVAERAKAFDQEGFDYLSEWAESVLGLSVKSTDDEILTFWDGSRIWHDSSFGWLVKEAADSNTAMMV